MTSWQANIITLTPNAYPGILGESVVGRALNAEKWQLNVKYLKDYALDKHKTVDDPPYGGGAGMVIRPDVLGRAIEEEFTNNGCKTYYMSPRGKVFSQKDAEILAKSSGINIICGRFEGVDQRVLEEYDIEELSIGDYILSGGDLAAMVVVDSCVRLLPSVLGSQVSLESESFSNGSNLLEHHQYTKPSIWKGREIPSILKTGHHQKIEEWRLNNAKEVTKSLRPDLWLKFENNTKK